MLISVLFARQPIVYGVTMRYTIGNDDIRSKCTVRRVSLQAETLLVSGIGLIKSMQSSQTDFGQHTNCEFYVFFKYYFLPCLCCLSYISVKQIVEKCTDFV